MIQRWIKAQRIGLIAYWLNNTPATLESGQGKIARRLLKEEIDSACKAYKRFIRILPLSILHIFSNISNNKLDLKLRALRIDFIKTLAQLKNSHDEESTPTINGAQIIAHHIFRGTGGAARIIRFASLVLYKEWKIFEKIPGYENKILPYIKCLRSNTSTTEEKLDSIKYLDEFLRGAGAFDWEQVENVLYQQILCWPLLVFDGGRSVGIVGGISLPVGIDVYLDGKSAVNVKGGGVIDVSQWSNHFKEVSYAAKVLWRSTHGNYGSLFRREINESSIVFDFSIADEIVRGLPLNVSLKDGSADSYFAQVILGRLLGKNTSISSAITGLIGHQMKGKLDFEFILPTGIKDKIKYVFQSSFFERVVIPAFDNEDKSKKEIDSFINSNKTDQTSEINYAKYLQNVADCVQIGGWRQFNYIRCPEIAWDINSKEQNLLPAEDKSVVKVLELLQNNKSCVLEMDNETTHLAVASALYHINGTLRNSIALKDHRPPMMSWSFIRAVEEEQDERFWQVIWRLTGSPQEDFELFQHSPTTQIASLRLAKALNCFFPTHTCLSNRSPDILVIINANKLSLTLDKMINPLIRSLAFRPILNEFRSGTLLRPIPYVRMEEFLGKTRIIVFPEEHHNSHFTHPVDLDKDDLNILILLSIFRYGFTQQMASILLKEFKLESLDIREKLQSLVTKRVIRYCNGKYHIPRKFSFMDGQKAKSTLTAKCHYSAGISLAPYVSTQEVPGLAYDNAFLPENIHEAEYHFTEAIELAKIIDDDMLFWHARASLEKIIHFADLEGWHTVCKSKGYSRDVYDVALYLLKSRRETGYPPHPGHILNVCKLATLSLKQSKHNEKINPIKLQDIINLYEDALDVCKDFPTEYNYNRLLVTTHYAVFLKKYERTNQSRIKELDEEATRLLLSGTNGSAAPGEWYELMGDENIDHSQASQFYVWGINWAPDWSQLWIKMFGTSFLIHNSITQILDYINNTPHEKVTLILSNALKGYENFIKNVAHDPVINRRWYEGLRIFEQVWGNNPSVFGMLQQFHDIRKL
ncbi:MAG: hypothetical protein NUV74_01540 [Candidatus Brocadiaceae bacterium]|nr:hypothetical protein [Candidatus Brocadiaceae bacterium]